MFFTRTALGLEISPEGLTMALVGKGGEVPRLLNSTVASFPSETLKHSLREPNILNPSVFVATVKEAHLRLLTKVERVSVSIPDSIGRVMVMDLETRFKNKEEGANMIRWKLKKHFPFDISEAHLDYQVLLEKESGEISALVSLISRSVLHQYEDLLAEAGLQPNQIDFTTFNLYALFARRLGIAENAAVFLCYDDIVSIIIFYGGVLTFYRSKEVVGGMREPNRIFREVSSSILVYGDKYPLYTIGEVFYIAPPHHADSFASMVAETMGQEPVLLDVSRTVAVNDGFDRNSLHSLAPALGAAARNL